MAARASLVSLLAAALLLGCGGGDDFEPAPEPAVTGPLDEKGNDLFVLRGPAEVADGRIEVTTDVVEWFNDRPKRNAGVADAEELVENWKEYGFDAVPPNAAASGEGSDSEVTLTKPETTEDGISFAYKTLRGEIASEDDAMSLFIDSSEWETDMHVYVYGPWAELCPGGNIQPLLENPVIVKAPHDWSVPPPQEFKVPNNSPGTQIFNAASSSGSTSFEVEYTLECQSDLATVTLKGSVPDNLNSDSFSCSVSDYHECASSQGGGYHVTATAKIYNP